MHDNVRSIILDQPAGQDLIVALQGGEPAAIAAAANAASEAYGRVADALARVLREQGVNLGRENRRLTAEQHIDFAEASAEVLEIGRIGTNDPAAALALALGEA